MCFSRKKCDFDDFEAFLWHFDFTKIIGNFFPFFRRYFQLQKYFKKVENFRIYGPVFELLAQTTNKFSTFLKTNRGWKHQHQKVEKLLFVVKNEKCLEEKKMFCFVNSTNVVNSTNRHWLVLQTESLRVPLQRLFIHLVVI